MQLTNFYAKHNSPTFPEKFLSLRSAYGKKVSDDVFMSLDRGRAILQDEDQLNQYLFSYGKMHHAKLKKAFEILFKTESFLQKKSIEVFDYGCGQGLASIVFLNLMEDYNIPIESLKKVTLIDAGKPALKRAQFFLKNSSDISTVHKELDSLCVDDLKTDNECVKLHLFSNILDMGESHFVLEDLTDKIKLNMKGSNYFVCVSPLNANRLEDFEDLIDSDKTLSVEDSDIGTWKRNHRVFVKEVA